VPNDFESLQDRLRRFAEARDWQTFHSPRNLALALAGEVGELAAELQWVADGEVPGHLRDPAARTRLADEIADVLIYLVRFADVCGIDILSETHAKIDRNEARFPPALASGAAPAGGARASAGPDGEG
jgi:NTP pyrophosphatase (non-canonical NTP hydrolase)